MALIVKIGANLDNFNKQMRKLTKDTKNVGGGLQDLGGKLTAGLTLPLVGVGAASIKTADDFQKSQGMMQARLGETSGRAKELESVARDVWKNGFGENVQAAADGVTMVNQNMKGMSNKEINGVTKSAFMLSDVFGFDLNESTRAGKALMDNFGVSGTKAMDLITVGAQKGGDYSGELLDTISEYSVQFSSMGMSADDMFNIFIQGAQNGAFNLDKVGDAVKEFNIRAQDGSKTTKEGFAMIGLNANQMGEAIAKGGDDGRKAFMATVAALAKMKDPMKQNQAGVALFGTQWEDVRGKVIKAMDPAVNKLGEVDGAAKRAGESAYNSLGDKFQQTMRSLGEALEPIGDVLLNMADQVFPVIQKAVSKLSNAFQSLSPSTQTFIVVLGLIAAAIGPVLAVVGTMIIAFGQLKAACVALEISMSAAFWWVALIIAALAAIVAVIVYWDEIKKYFAVFWAYLQSLFSAALNFINGLFASIWGGIVSLAQTIWGGLLNYFKAELNAYATLFSIIWNGIKAVTSAVWSAISGFLSGLWNGISSTAQAVWNGIVNFFKSMMNGLASFFTTIWNGIKSVTSAVWSGIKGALSGIWNGISGAAKAVWNGLSAYFSFVLNAYKTIFMSVWNAIKGFLVGLWNGIVSIGHAVWSGLVSFFSGVFSTIFGVTTTVWNAIKSVIVAVWNGIRSGVSSAINTVSSVVSGVWNGIRSVTSSVWNGIKNAIVSPISAAKDKIGGIVNAIKGFFSGMHLSLPRIKMPHFSIDGKFSLAPPSVPKLNIKWFKTGGVIKGTPGGSLIGAGDGGDEAVVPLSNKSRMLPFAQAIASMIGSGNDEDTSNGPRILRLENVLNLDGRELARILQPMLDIVNADKITIDAIMSGGLPG